MQNSEGGIPCKVTAKGGSYMTHVLILEDDRASMEALEKILKEYSENICVHTASSYEEAKELLTLMGAPFSK